MTDEIGSLPQTGASEPAPSDNVGGKEQQVTKVEAPAKVSVRESIGKAFDEVSSKAPEPAKPNDGDGDVEPPVETEQQKADRLRDERGRFAQGEKPEQKPAKVQIDPPVRWGGDQKTKWANVPNEIKAAIAEDDKKFAELEGRAAQWDTVITPQRRQALQVAYGDERQGLNQILATVEFSNTDPKGFVSWFAKTRGIDIGSLVPSQQEPQQGGLPPELERLLQPVLSKVTTLEQQLQQSTSAIQQQETARTQQEVNSFFSDHTNFPFAQDVRKDMAALFQSGMVTKAGSEGLKEAYDRAVWANPVTRQKLQAEQASKLQQAQQTSVSQKRQLASSVTGAPGTAKPIPMAPIKENPRETVRRVLSESARIN